MVEYKGALDVISKTFRSVGTWHDNLFLFNELQTSFLFLVSNPSTLKGGTDIARLKQFDRELDGNLLSPARLRTGSSFLMDFPLRLSTKSAFSWNRYSSFSGPVSRRVLFKS